MNPTLLVCDLEYAKKIKELGVVQESYFVIRTDGYSVWHPKDKYEYIYDLNVAYSAWTTTELGIMLPEYITGDELYSPMITKKITTSKKPYMWGCNYYGGVVMEHPFDWITAETEVNARAKMLIHLIENKHVTAEEVNERLKGVKE